MKTKKGHRKLRKVIAVRHGEYSGLGSSESLNEDGKAQMALLTVKIMGLVGNGRVEVLSSPEPRACQSAEIIAKELKCDYRVCQALIFDQHASGLEMMNKMLEVRGGSEVIIAVTHFEAPSGIIEAFARKHFQKQFECREAQKGNGFMLCLETGTITEDILSL